MIQAETKLKVADNTGARIIECFKVPGGTRKRYAKIGDIIIASVKLAEPRGTIKKKAIVKAVIVRQRKPFRRKDGSYISFSDNAAVIVEGMRNSGKGLREDCLTRSRSLVDPDELRIYNEYTNIRIMSIV